MDKKDFAYMELAIESILYQNKDEGDDEYDDEIRAMLGFCGGLFNRNETVN